MREIYFGRARSALALTTLLLSLSNFALPAFAQHAETAGCSDRAPSVRPEAGWRLVWRDEFASIAIDTQRWSHVVNCWGGGNNEKQCYTSRAVNSFVLDGCLHIVAQPEPEDGADTTLILPYSSARLRTRGKGDWTYGRFEARIRLPGGQGVWPAFWMLPTDRQYGDWPGSGEIDIVEAVNLGAGCPSCVGGREDRVAATLHFSNAGTHAQLSRSQHLGAGAIADFHVYAVEWRPTGFEWFVDGVRIFSVSSEQWGERRAAEGGAPNAPFDQRFHIILNLAIGGAWPESANDEGVDRDEFPKTMQVDWVRVYECGIGGADGCRAP